MDFRFGGAAAQARGGRSVLAGGGARRAELRSDSGPGSARAGAGAAYLRRAAFFGAAFLLAVDRLTVDLATAFLLADFFPAAFLGAAFFTAVFLLLTLRVAFLAEDFLAAAFFGAAFLADAFFGAAFLAEAFFTAFLAAAFFGAAFLAAAFFGAAFLAAAFFGAAFLAAAFFGAAFLAAAFFGAAFLAAAFFGAAFLAAAFFGAAFLAGACGAGAPIGAAAGVSPVDGMELFGAWFSVSMDMVVFPSDSGFVWTRCWLELAVIAFLQGIEQVGGGVHFAVVFHLLVALQFDNATVFQFEAVEGAFQVGFLHQHALEGGRVEAEGGASLQALLVGVEVDVLEVFVGVVGGHVGGLGNGRVDPFLRGGLDVHVLLRADVVGSHEVLRQLGGRVVGERQRVGVDEGAVGEQLVAVDLDLFLGLLALADHVARVVVGEAGLDAVGGVVGQRQRDRAGRRDRAVVGKARAGLGELLDQVGGDGGDALHVAAVLGVL